MMVVSVNNILKLIRFQFVLLALAIPFSLSGCYPWPSGGEDPDPVNLESVATSEIEIYLESAVFEELDRFRLTVLLSDQDDAPLLLDTDSSLDFQILDEVGTYRSLDFPEEGITTFESRFDITAYSAPATYRLMLNRSNGEEVELVNFVLKAKFKSNSTIGNATTFGNGDIFEFDWGFYDQDNVLDIYPQGGLRYSLECENERFDGNMQVERNSGLVASPFLVHIDDIIPQSSSIEFPCMATFIRDYYLFEPENAYKILSGDIGSSTSRPRQIGNGADLHLEVYPKKYEIVINSN